MKNTIRDLFLYFPFTVDWLLLLSSVQHFVEHWNYSENCELCQKAEVLAMDVGSTWCCRLCWQLRSEVRFHIILKHIMLSTDVIYFSWDKASCFAGVLPGSYIQAPSELKQSLSRQVLYLQVRNNLRPYYRTENTYQMTNHIYWACMCRFKQEVDCLLYS